jgi:cytochrome c553
MAWAYPAAKSEQADAGFFKHQGSYTLPGSRLKLTEAQLDDSWAAVDWLPSEHPPAPPVVLHGRQPDTYACGLCHMVNGQGGHGVPSLAGLPRDYIAAQVAAFASGQRASSFFLRDAANMTTVARAARPAEIAAAADYYARLPYRPWIRVVEAAKVPATAPSYWGWTEALPGPRRDPIGVRIVEVAEDRQRAGMSDPHSGFIAYVPPGSVARGRALAERGVGGQPPCAACHGPHLTGSSIAPPLAGRSPTYLARQLWDIRTGARRGAGAAPMRPVARVLDAEGIVDITAYLASLRP